MFAHRSSSGLPPASANRMTLQARGNENSMSKTPSSKKGLGGSSSSTTKRRALGDISNTKGNNNNGGGFGSGNGGKSGVKKSLFVFDDRSKSSSTRSTKPKQPSSISWQDQQMDLPRSIIKSKQLQSKSRKPQARSKTSTTQSHKMSVGPVEEIERYAGRSFQEQQALMDLESWDDDDFQMPPRDWQQRLWDREEDEWLAAEQVADRAAMESLQKLDSGLSFDDVAPKPTTFDSPMMTSMELFDDDLPLHEQIDMSFLDL